jgi:hypothetical protein
VTNDTFQRIEMIKHNSWVAALAAAVAYKCGHCGGHVTSVSEADDGVMHLRVNHRESCPVLGGAICGLADSVRAVATAEIDAEVLPPKREERKA